MFERFTDRARRIVVLAQEEARMLNHNYIGTEHILLGLIHEGGGTAATVLDSLGISLDDVRDQVEAIVGQGKTAPAGHIPFTPRAKKVLELSLREALQLGHSYIGAEHILLGLIREGEGVAVQVLQRLDVDLKEVRRQIAGQLGRIIEDDPPRERRWLRRGAASRSGPMESSVEGTSLLEQFDDAGWRALIAARASARSRHAPGVRLVDLLAGVAAVAGPGAVWLEAAGVDLSQLRTIVEDLDTGGHPSPSPLLFDGAVHVALAEAVNAARYRNHAEATTGHMLWALVDAPAPEVEHALDAQGVSATEVLDRVTGGLNEAA